MDRSDSIALLPNEQTIEKTLSETLLSEPVVPINKILTDAVVQKEWEAVPPIYEGILSFLYHDSCATVQHDASAKPVFFTLKLATLMS